MKRSEYLYEEEEQLAQAWVSLQQAERSLREGKRPSLADELIPLINNIYKDIDVVQQLKRLAEEEEATEE